MACQRRMISNITTVTPAIEMTTVMVTSETPGPGKHKEEINSNTKINYKEFRVTICH